MGRQKLFIKLERFLLLLRPFLSKKSIIILLQLFQIYAFNVYQMIITVYHFQSQFNQNACVVSVMRNTLSKKNPIQDLKRK